MNTTQLSDLREHAKNNTYVAHGDIADADCVIGFSFGYRQSESGIKPGVSNQQIAAYIVKNLNELPLILQFEINDALTNKSSDLVIR